MNTTENSLPTLRPAEICKALLAALEAAEGRTRKRKRDQTPDTIGLSIKRSVLARAGEELAHGPAEGAAPVRWRAVDCSHRASLAADVCRGPDRRGTRAEIARCARDRGTG